LEIIQEKQLRNSVALQESRAGLARAGDFQPYSFTATAVVGALGSMATTGFVFGIDNNVYHLPIVARLYDAPQFAEDLFIQAMRFYAAGPWLLLQGAERYIDPYWMFLGLWFLTRLIGFVGFLACADLLGIRTLAQRALFSGLLCLTPIMQGVSYIGVGDLFRNYFTHSEIPIGLTLLAIYFTARGALIPAIMLHGCTFFVNFFIAIWNAFAFAAQLLYATIARQLVWRRAMIQCAIGAVCVLPLCVPVVWNVINNPIFGRPLGFDFVDYLRESFPFHYLFDSFNTRVKIAMLSIVLLAGLSFIGLGPSARHFLAALGGYLIVYGLGIVAPDLTNNYFILILQLLRVSTMFHLLAALGAIALAVQWLMGGNAVRARIWAPLLIAFVCADRVSALFAPLIVLAGILLKADRPVPTLVLRGGTLVGLLAVAGLLVAKPYHWWREAENNRIDRQWISEWNELAAWARRNTTPDSIFLIPMVRAGESPPDDPIGLARWYAAHNATSFEFSARRRIWVDFKRGAAVAVYPPYYSVWHQRITEVLALRSHHDWLHYARNNRIGYVIEVCQQPWDSSALFRTNRLCLYQASSQAGTGRKSLQLARFLGQHDRDAVADRIGELGGARNQLLPGGVVFEPALGQRANQNFEQLWIDAAGRTV